MVVVASVAVVTVSLPGPSAVSATPNRSGRVTVPVAAYTPDAPTLQREGWTASASQSLAGDPAEAALDANAFSDWVAAVGPATPASITIDMRAPQVVSGLIYEPPQTPSPVGVIGRYSIGVSNDGVTFITVATGTWSDTTVVKQIGFDPADTRFVRLTAVSPAAGTGTEVAAAEIYLQGVPHVLAAPAPSNTLTAQRLLATQAPTISTNPAVVGEWGPTIGFPIIPVAAALLPNNEMLVWSADQALAYGGGNDPYTQTAILNLTTGAVSEDTVSNTNHNMFCPGVVILPDGEVMVTGGLSDQQTSIYNPATNTWRAGPPMNIGRGYQGMTLLSNGQAFTLGGSWSGLLGGKLGEIWSPTGSWRELTNVPATPMYTADAQGVYRADNHGWFIASSGGSVLQAGPSKQMNWISTTGAGSITPAGTRGTSADAMNGNAVYYDTNKVITMGGAPDYQNANATNQAYQVQIGSPGTDPTVTQVGSMNYARAFANSVVLPNGQVVTMGGQTYAVPFSDANSVLNAELWDPTTGTFTVMAPEAEPRNYHSVGILLPDGRVFSGGGGLCGTCSTNHPDGQIFTPPYLLNADGTLRTRPTITSAPTTAATGQTITVTTGGPVTQFAMVRYGESTHSVDNDQRRVPLSIVSSSGDTYQLAVPSDPGIALPGPYMLFALDASGTPSVSTTLSITNVATQPPSNPYGRTVFLDGPAAYWPLNDTGGATATDVSGNGDTGSYLGGGFTYGVPSPAEGSGGRAVTLNGTTSQIVASQPITDPTTYTEEMWFKTTTTSGGTLMGFGTSPSGTTSTSRDRIVYMANNGQIYFGVYAGTPVTINTPLSYNDGAWHHLVATQGPDGMHLYVDGQPVAANTTAGAQSYLGYWRVGAENLAGWSNSPTSNYFAGTLSDVAFYSAELSAGQVLADYQAAPPPPPSCPVGWTCSDIGGPLPTGHQTLTGSSWSVIGGGGDIWGTSDAFHLVDQTLAADGTVTAHVTGQTDTSVWAKAGVMLRSTTDPGSPYYAAFVTPANGVAVQWRTVQGGTSTQVTTPGTVPTYLRVARTTAGGVVTYTAYTSTDGTTWTAVPGSTQTVSGLSGSVLAGLAVTSHNQGTASTAGFDTVSVTAAAPTVSAVSPPSGTSAGGTAVTITGTGFTGATRVAFGTVAASYTVVSSTQITAVSPAEPAGLRNVFVTTPGGTSAAVMADWFYVAPPPPTVSAVSPPSGTSAGGTAVTITGTGFTGATRVAFGTVAASYTVVSSTQITAVSPAEPAGLRNVFVTTPGGTSAAVMADWFYVAPPPPTVSAVSPPSGTSAGGTAVTITGTGFTGATRVAFGTVAASYTVVSSTQITAVSPAEPAGLRNVFVTTPGGTSAAVMADWFYVGP